jgi:hypothetical protein
VTSPATASIVKGIVNITWTQSGESIAYTDVVIDGVSYSTTGTLYSWNTTATLNGLHVVVVEVVDTGGFSAEQTLYLLVNNLVWTGSSSEVTLIVGTGGNCSTPSSYFAQNGFSVTTHGASNVTLQCSVAPPPGTGAPPSGTSGYSYLSVHGNLSTGSTAVILYVFYNRTKVQSLHLDESTLAIYVWNATTASWQALTTTHLVINATTGCLFATLPHFSYFAVLGSSPAPSGVSPVILVTAVAVIAVIVVLALVLYLKKRKS